MLNLGHKRLDAWKLSIELIAEIYKLTEGFPKTEIYGITNQLRRASVSVSSNIAEGASRKSGAERKRFYEIARSSLVEIDTQLEISIKLEFCKTNDLTTLNAQINHLFAMISNLIKSTK